MSLTRKKTAELNTSSTIKAAKRAQKASSAAAANAASAAQNAALTAQNAAGVAQTATQNAAVVATNAAQNAVVVATNAAQNASDAAQTAATSLSKGVKERVYTARTWAAPRLENAADYTSSTVAPKVSAALRSTARQVQPADAKSSRKTILTWSVLGAAVLAALGAAAAVARYRYRTAIAADTETADEEVMADSADSQAAPVTPDGTLPADAKPADQGTETSVNGRVTATGW
jgi:trimeric autotransporter adhesin